MIASASGGFGGGGGSRASTAEEVLNGTSLPDYRTKKTASAVADPGVVRLVHSNPPLAEDHTPNLSGIHIWLTPALKKDKQKPFKD